MNEQSGFSPYLVSLVASFTPTYAFYRGNTTASRKDTAQSASNPSAIPKFSIMVYLHNKNEYARSRFEIMIMTNLKRAWDNRVANRNKEHHEQLRNLAKLFDPFEDPETPNDKLAEELEDT
ncbi:hypothetical protein CC78DRAFT_584800 [Lojkania enalia]|uniref:Uncharacterized protein n=1 Tax=Lojkania enalia TaxID=147567 RepID=A0A9P4K0B0_9PLEO|nr:hypothetical protein CC78DRAFT_584800 [Didymosphaeria enalia]